MAVLSYAVFVDVASLPLVFFSYVEDSLLNIYIQHFTTMIPVATIYNDHANFLCMGWFLVKKNMKEVGRKILEKIKSPT